MFSFSFHFLLSCLYRADYAHRLIVNTTELRQTLPRRRQREHYGGTWSKVTRNQSSCEFYLLKTKHKAERPIKIITKDWQSITEESRHLLMGNCLDLMHSVTAQDSKQNIKKKHLSLSP